MDKILMIGTGGLARELTQWVSGYFEITGYSSTKHDEHMKFNLPGKLYSDKITPAIAGTDKAMIATGSPHDKTKIFHELTALGFKFPFFIHPTSTVADTVKIGEGVIISPNCVIAPNVELCALVYINFCVGIGHETIVGRFTQINPGAQIGGGATIGEEVLVGSGATVLQNVTIGNKAKIGSGSVVFSKLQQNVTVIGNPAKRIRILETAK